MPLFDFRCSACGARFEALVRVSDPPPACRACGSSDLERELPHVAISTEGQSQRALRAARIKARGAHRDRVEYQREIEEKHKD